MLLSLLCLHKRAKKTKQEISQKTAEVLGSRHCCEAVAAWVLQLSCGLCLWQMIPLQRCSAPFLQDSEGWEGWELCGDGASSVSKPSLLRQHIGCGELCSVPITAAPQMASSSALDSCTCLPFNVQGNWKPGKMAFPAFAQSLNPMKHLQCS